MPVPPGLSPKDADQVLRAVMDDSNNRLRVDAEITAVVTDLEIRASSGDNIAITNQDGSNPLVIEPDGSINTNTTIVGGELAVEIDAVDGDNIAISNQAGTNKMEVNADGSINITDNGSSITVDQGTTPWIIDGTVAATQSGTWNINNITGTISLPTGASTSANQVTGNASLASIDSKLNTLGQKTSADSVPVVIASDQSPITVTGTVTTSPDVNVHDGTGVSISSTGSSLNVNVTNTVPVSQSISPWVVSGTVTANAGTGSFTVVQPSGANLHVDIDNFPATQPISGTVTALQGTSPWVVSGTVTSNIGTTGGLALDTSVKETHGSASGGTAATVSELAGAIYNSTPPTLTNGQQASLQLDSSGNLKTTATVTIPGTVSVTQGTTPWVENVSQFGGNNVVTGTGASGLGIPRVTVSNDSNILATQSGAWSVNVNNAAGASAINIQDGGNSITVDGTITVVQPTGTNLHTVVDSGSITVNNAAGASAVNIQDGGNSITVDGTVTVSNFPTTVDTNYGTVGSNTIRTAAQIGNATGAALFGAGTTTAQVLRVVLPTDQTAIPVTQSGTWTVQQGTPPWSVVGNVASGAADSGNPVKTGAIYNSTTPTFTNGQRTDSQSDTTGAQFVNSESMKATYSAAAQFTIAATPTDVFTITGSATKTIRINKLSLNGSNTGNTNAICSLIRRSTTDTGGTSSILTNVPADTTQAAGTATVRSYTANPTLGTTVGTFRNDEIFLPVLASTNANLPVKFVFGEPHCKAIVLRGTSEVIALNFNGATIGGTTVLAVDITWTEE